MEETIFHTFRDGETIDYWDPVVSTVQGSLAEERRTSTGRIGKDRKEFKLVQRLNKLNRISLADLLNCKVTATSKDENVPNTAYLEDRLSHLGARYPDVPGLGIYVNGLSKLEQYTEKLSNGKTKRRGPETGRKIFNLLFWISSRPELTSYYKFIILNKIGKLVLNQTNQGKWMQNSTTMLVLLGKNEVAYTWGYSLLQNKSAVRDSLEAGKRLAQQIYIQFYENVNPYSPKVRRRGYARSSPVRPGSSKKAILEANHSIEYLTETKQLIKSEQGGYDMAEEKVNTEELLFKIFSNSLETFEFLQKERMEQLGIRKPTEEVIPQKVEENSST